MIGIVFAVVKGGVLHNPTPLPLPLKVALAVLVVVALVSLALKSSRGVTGSDLSATVDCHSNVSL